jgi:GNAT superfamily N-acetyltransferase
MATVDVRIRDATPDDARGVAHIYVASRRAAWRGIIDDDYLDGLDVVQEARSMRTFLEDPDPGWGTRVAEDVRILGYLTSGPEEEAPSSAHVGALFVAPEAFGAGIGSQLLADAESRFRRLGFVDAFLWSLVDDPRAVKFYVHRGWVPDGGRMAIELDRSRQVIRCRKVFDVVAGT